MAEIKIIINGKECTGTAGQTILQIAAQNGIEIPNLCENGQLKHYAGCGLCVVEAEGCPKLLRACSTIPKDGQVIMTDSPRAAQSRKITMELLMSDHVGDCKGPCMLNCPAGTECQAYVKQIALGNDREAVRIIKEKIPMPSSIGRVCPHPCETACRRKYVEQPISIAYLKYFAADRVRAAGGYQPEVKPATGKKVGVIGGGPGGLAAAYYLACKGHDVTVVDAMPKMGGMLRYGIPDYRLPQYVLDRDIEHILSAGIEVHTNVSVGTDVEISRIQQQYDAVYISIGAHADKKLGIEGEDSENVISAVHLLRGIGDGHVPDFTGKRVCIIGGGNVSMDATRTARRLGAQSVTCVYRRRIDDMTALHEEIEEAMAEGCQILPLQAPSRIEADSEGKVCALWTRPQMIGPYGRDGRPSPQNAGKPEFRIACDYVIVAIGQSIDSKPFEAIGISTNRGSIVAEPSAAVPGVNNVFAGGDAVSGPATVIRAVAAGKVAADNIDAFLGFSHTIRTDVEIPPAQMTNTPACGRVNLKNIHLAEYKDNFSLVTEGMSKEEACQESSRCLRCDHFGFGLFKGGRSTEW